MTNVHTLQSESKTHVHTLQQFDKFFKKKCQICVIVVFNNVNTVRSEMWVLVFPHHSCQKLIKSLVFDSWFDNIFWHLWCGKSHTHISSSQHSLNVHVLESISKHSVNYLPQWLIYVQIPTLSLIFAVHCILVY